MRTVCLNKLTHEEPIVLSTHNHGYMSPHRHTFFELVYVCKGKAEHIMNQVSSLVGAGDFFLMDPDTAHEYRPIGAEGGLQIINCLFLPEGLDDSVQEAKEFRDILEAYLARYGYSRFGTPPLCHVFHDESGMVRTLMTQMLREYNEQLPGYRDILHHLLLTLMIQLMRAASPGEAYPGGQLIRDIREYVNHHYMEPLSLSLLCEELHFSLPYVSTAFHREIGMTFRTYVGRVRIEKACHLLRMTDRTVADIAAHLGYSDPAFFYKVFRREMEMTPDQYRKNGKV